MNSSSVKLHIVVVAVLGLLSGSAGGVVGYKVMDYYDGKDGGGVVADESGSSAEEHVYVEQSKITDAIDKVSPAVVSIMVSKNVQVGGGGINPFFNDPFFDQFFNNNSGNGNGSTEPEYQYKKIGGGSGFIVSETGFVLTNKHVVSDEKADYTVVTEDGKEYAGKVVSRDPFADLAVVQMYEIPEDEAKSSSDDSKKSEQVAPTYDFDKLKKPSKLPKVEIGSSSKLRVGQYVLAIGNALAEFENTVTLGIVSATGRSIVASDGGGGSENLSDLIQTDAAINPGNSGGPLVNLDGQVVGINVAIAQSAQGIGFAIPVDDVKSVLSSVEKYGEIVRPVLGVRYMMLDAASAKELMIKVDHGALLVGDEEKGQFAVIPGEAGDKAGLKIKDVILEVDGEKVTVDNTLSSVISKYAPGDKVKLKVWRSGDEIEVDVTLGSSKDLE